MRLVLEFMSIAYVLILAYLVLTHGKAAEGIAGTLFGGTNKLVRSFQGR